MSFESQSLFPHADRLLRAIESLDSPLIQLWGWPGSGCIAVLEALLARQGRRAVLGGGPAAGGRALAGAGAAAAMLDTPGGPTLQVAGTRFVVTLVVQGRTPADGAWRTAARQAVARLPR